MAAQTSPIQPTRRRPSTFGVLAAVVLVAVVGVYLASGVAGSGAGTAHVHDGHAAAADLPTFVPQGAPVHYGVTADRRVVLKDLGLTLTLPPELAQEGLIGVPGADPAHPSKSISFATAALAAGASACTDNGTRGWLGTLTRYEGSSSSMADHASHQIAMFDYPGFHTTYRAVTQSCAVRTPGFGPDDLAPERRASTELWEAVRGAQPASATG